jgi:hypothetical protein
MVWKARTSGDPIIWFNVILARTTVSYIAAVFKLEKGQWNFVGAWGWKSLGLRSSSSKFSNITDAGYCLKLTAQQGI